MVLRSLFSAFTRERFSLTHDEMRDRVILQPQPENKLKHLSLSYDECFFLGCYFLSLTKHKLSKELSERMEGTLGGNFWKVINQALVDPPRKQFADTQLSEAAQLRQQVLCVRDEMREKKREAEKEIYDLKQQLEYQNNNVARLTQLNGALERDCETLKEKLDGYSD